MFSLFTDRNTMAAQRKVISTEPCEKMQRHRLVPRDRNQVLLNHSEVSKAVVILPDQHDVFISAQCPGDLVEVNHTF